MDIVKTKIKILFNERTQDLFAFFPEFDETVNKDGTYFLAYSHIGQHSGCHIDYANESREATDEEAKDLLEELKSIGYEKII